MVSNQFLIKTRFENTPTHSIPCAKAKSSRSTRNSYKSHHMAELITAACCSYSQAQVLLRQDDQLSNCYGFKMGVERIHMHENIVECTRTHTTRRTQLLWWLRKTTVKRKKTSVFERNTVPKKKHTFCRYDFFSSIISLVPQAHTRRNQQITTIIYRYRVWYYILYIIKKQSKKQFFNYIISYL